jgi:hypothetical protein
MPKDSYKIGKAQIAIFAAIATIGIIGVFVMALFYIDFSKL